MALGGGAVRQWPWAPLAVASGSFGPGRGLVREASMKPRSCSSAESDEGGNTDAALGVCSRGLHKARESRSRTGQAGRRWVGSRGPGIDMGCGNAFCPSHSPAETPSTRTCVTEPRALSAALRPRWAYRPGPGPRRSSSAWPGLRSGRPGADRLAARHGTARQALRRPDPRRQVRSRLHRRARLEDHHLRLLTAARGRSCCQRLTPG